MIRYAIYCLLFVLVAAAVGCGRDDEPVTEGDGAVQPSQTTAPAASPTPTPTPTPDATPVPEPTPTPVPVPTPVRLEHTPTPASPLTQEFINRSVGYSISYPRDWLAGERGDSLAIVHPTGMQVVVTAAPLQGVSVDEFLETYLDGISRRAEFTETSRVDVDSPEGVRIAGILHGPGVFLVLDLVATVNGDTGLVAGSIASAFDVDLHKLTLESMVSSFETFPPTQSSAADRGGLWAGAAPEGGLILAAEPLALFVNPGVEADADPWRLTLQGVAFRCSPEPHDLGWDLTGCTGAQDFDGVPIDKITVPSDGDTLQITFGLGEATFTASLTKLSESREEIVSDNVSLLWDSPSDGHSGVWAEDGLVFVPRFDGVIEMLDAGSGRRVGVIEVPEVPPGHVKRVSDAQARDGLLYAGTAHNGVVIFDVSDPENPQTLGNYGEYTDQSSPDDFFNVHRVFLPPDGDLLYAVNASFPEDPAEAARTEFKSDLRVIDVSDPGSPAEVGRFSIDTDAVVSDVSVTDVAGRTVAFLNYWEAGLWILDVTDPGSISPLGSIAWDGIRSHSGQPFRVGDRWYYAHTEQGYDRHLTILDVTELSDPRVVSRYQTRPGVSMNSVEVVDGIAYVAYYLDGLRVVDLRDPSDPREIAHFDTVHARSERSLYQGAFGVRVLDGVVYLADSRTGTYALGVDTG